ncbi:hypothetical protein GIB67_020433 [Kingdonia uniflora]|uniref:Cupin type-1 domain-containing protein n=1 Tax=Kingdonia uniflora TaxID=39325 RepID=A0A7J7LUT0_9MAGN|nr:hypothetical protein GIB67_020433 [Kingdonia uniflora]
MPSFPQKSKVLRGLENWRLAIFEANPNTFVIPNHWDAEIIAYVVKGRGILTLVVKQNRESYNLERGDVIRIPAGTLAYLINRDNNEKLQIAKLINPVSTPDQFEVTLWLGKKLLYVIITYENSWCLQAFIGAGGKDTQSFYRSFSNDILEAAFNTPRDQLEKLFGKQRKGAIIGASKEQIKALSRHASSSSEGGSVWPWSTGSKFRGPYNLLKQKPWEWTDRDDMSTPCSPKPEAGRTRTGARANWWIRLSKGHPVAIVASENENLQLVIFGINAQYNQKIFLAGNENVINQLEKEAKELSFNVPAREVDAVFKNQREAVFLPGPNQRQQSEEGGRQGPLASIFDFEGF